MVEIPEEPTFGSMHVLDSDQIRIMPRKRVIWNEDLEAINNAPPLEGDTAHSGWRFTWGGVKEQDIAIEKEQVRHNP